MICTLHSRALDGYGPVIGGGSLRPLRVSPPVPSGLFGGSLARVDALLQALIGVCGALRVEHLVEDHVPTDLVGGVEGVHVPLQGLGYGAASGLRGTLRVCQESVSKAPDRE